MAARDLDSRIEEIESPVLLLHGRHDAVLAVANSWHLHQRLPDSELFVFEESGHAPFAEQAELFAEVVDEFLAR